MRTIDTKEFVRLYEATYNLDYMVICDDKII
jgi:hypothetical protein